MKWPCLDSGAEMMLGIALALVACSTERAMNAADGNAAAPVGPDLPAAMALMQPQAAYADLAELRHFSAYNTFHAMQGASSGGNGGNGAVKPASASCFGNQ